MVLRIQFRKHIFDINLTERGFKLNKQGTEKWNYISYENIENYITYLNNSGNLNLSVPLDERHLYNLPNDMSVFRNIALLVKILYPKHATIKDKSMFLLDKIKFTIEDLLERRNKLLIAEERFFFIDKDSLIETDKNQTTLF